MTAAWPPAITCLRVMRFWVSVPVLSTHRTVVLPKVSTAAIRRVSTPLAGNAPRPKREEDGQHHGDFLGQDRHGHGDAGQEALLPNRDAPPRVRA